MSDPARDEQGDFYRSYKSAARRDEQRLSSFLKSDGASSSQDFYRFDESTERSDEQILLSFLYERDEASSSQDFYRFDAANRCAISNCKTRFLTACAHFDCTVGFLSSFFFLFLFLFFLISRSVVEKRVPFSASDPRKDAISLYVSADLEDLRATAERRARNFISFL